MNATLSQIPGDGLIAQISLTAHRRRRFVARWTYPIVVRVADDIADRAALPFADLAATGSKEWAHV